MVCTTIDRKRFLSYYILGTILLYILLRCILYYVICRYIIFNIIIFITWQNLSNIFNGGPYSIVLLIFC